MSKALNKAQREKIEKLKKNVKMLKKRKTEVDFYYSPSPEGKRNHSDSVLRNKSPTVSRMTPRTKVRRWLDFEFMPLATISTSTQTPDITAESADQGK